MPDPRDIEPASFDENSFDEPIPGPEHVPPEEVPWPNNDQEGPDPEPPHLALGSPRVDEPGPNPYEPPSPEIP